MTVVTVDPRGLEGRPAVVERGGQGRVQDGGLMEMSDRGVCLSMHQVIVLMEMQISFLAQC